MIGANKSSKFTSILKEYPFIKTTVKHTVRKYREIKCLSFLLIKTNKDVYDCSSTFHLLLVFSFYIDFSISCWFLVFKVIIQCKLQNKRLLCLKKLTILGILLRLIWKCHSTYCTQKKNCLVIIPDKASVTTIYT